MLKIISATLSAAIAALVWSAASSQAAELVMVELKSCVYCAKFDREMASAYENSETGRSVPLRRINPRKWPSDLAAVKKTPYTPVFILVDEGREIGRFAGYSGSAQFQSKLGQLLARR
jgi:thioredoxin-related protein